jgi:hypothetical protein
MRLKEEVPASILEKEPVSDIEERAKKHDQERKLQEEREKDLERRTSQTVQHIFGSIQTTSFLTSNSLEPPMPFSEQTDVTSQSSLVILGDKVSQSQSLNRKTSSLLGPPRRHSNNYLSLTTSVSSKIASESSQPADDELKQLLGHTKQYLSATGLNISDQSESLNVSKESYAASLSSNHNYFDNENNKEMMPQARPSLSNHTLHVAGESEARHESQELNANHPHSTYIRRQ